MQGRVQLGVIRTNAAAVIFSASAIVTSMVSAGAQNVRVRAARAEEPRAASVVAEEGPKPLKCLSNESLLEESIDEALVVFFRLESGKDFALVDDFALFF